ncbi:diphthine methyltransferase [Lasioglossum baleicum]|uniref:diphthine methyltransferase n=1 Tax=Lasioglossum baleicum TaxID=434251 RepID=UPI003FCCCE08
MFYNLDSFDTELSADSVEWCPSDSHKNIFVCGTYQLIKDNELKVDIAKTKRFGRIYMFKVDGEGHLTLLQKLEVPAVLDMKWAHTWRNRILLGVVNSLGYLQIYQMTTNKEKENLELLMEKKVADDEEVLALSLDWCSGRWSHDNESNLSIVVSDSKGSLTLFEINENELICINSWHAHEFEAWITAFDYWDTNVIYSGGDDSKFRRFDIRIGTNPTAISKVHEAGVTSLHSNATREHLLASGSYDESLRLWDTRNWKTPVSRTDLGGGVWRLKWDPFARKYLLAACMLGGFRIVDCENTEAPHVIGEYNEHKSLAYGCDWSFLNSAEVPKRALNKETCDVCLIGTCSFYDHLLKLSAVYLKDN